MNASVAMPSEVELRELPLHGAKAVETHDRVKLKQLMEHQERSTLESVEERLFHPEWIRQAEENGIETVQGYKQLPESNMTKEHADVLVNAGILKRVPEDEKRELSMYAQANTAFVVREKKLGATGKVTLRLRPIFWTQLQNAQDKLWWQQLKAAGVSMDLPTTQMFREDAWRLMNNDNFVCTQFDMVAAYFQHAIPDTADRRSLVFEIAGELYVACRMTMGSVLAPFIQQTYCLALVRACVRQSSVCVRVYIDNAFMLGDEHEVEQAATTFKSLADEARVTFTVDVEAARNTDRIRWLGIEFDGAECVLRPGPKLQLKLDRLILALVNQAEAGAKLFKSLWSALTWAGGALITDWSMHLEAIRTARRLKAGKRGTANMTELEKEQMAAVVHEIAKGYPLRKNKQSADVSDTVNVWTDASGVGAGVIVMAGSRQWSWGTKFPAEIAKQHINVKEVHAVRLGAVAVRERLIEWSVCPRAHVQFWCDSQVAIATIKKRWSRSPILAEAVRDARHELARLHSWTIQFVETKENKADAPSRGYGVERWS